MVVKTLSPQIPVNEINWKRCDRIITTRFPAIHLYERVAEPSDWDALNSLETMTNDRIRGTSSQAEIPSSEDWESNRNIFIDGCFGHPNTSRFSNGDFAVFYAAHDLKTAIAETKYHKEKFMSATSEPPTNIEMMRLKTHIEGGFQDIRGMQSALSDIYDPDDYGPANRLGENLYIHKSNGVIFDSVRLSDGQCIGAFNHKTVKTCQFNSYLLYIWDGTRISRIMQDIKL